jgi:hypothetical protein
LSVSIKRLSFHRPGRVALALLIMLVLSLVRSGSPDRLFSTQHPALASGPQIAAVPDAAPAAAEYPTMEDFWAGRARWYLDVKDTGLPVGESDTLYMGNGIYWSYLHASTQSAGVKDSCGDDVEFPGCVTRWVSTDNGAHFSLPKAECIFKCDSCPCDADDMTAQQQYPRVVRAGLKTFYMVYEHGAASWISQSSDGLKWTKAKRIGPTGAWDFSDKECSEVYQIGDHPYAAKEKDCMAGGPPGLYVTKDRVYVFVGLGQSPGHMGCVKGWRSSPTYFSPCTTEPLFDGATWYGPSDAHGTAANPYFDFRYATSADVINVGGVYYMSYEGIRGPDSPTAGRDTQFGLGFARSTILDGKWEKYAHNPVLNDISDSWGIGHADLLVVDGQTIMYTGAAFGTRARYVLVWN